MHYINPLLSTDVYKMGHMEQYAPGCNKLYSYLMARSGDVFEETVFFGLQYYLKAFLSIPLTEEMGEEFLLYRKLIVGNDSPFVEQQIRSLCKLGYFPLEIKAVEEGDIIPVRNVLMTMTNTLPDFYWVVGFVESLLLKVWYPTTVATCCFSYRKVVEKYFNRTVDDQQMMLKELMVHDFGYRGDKSEDAAQISGAAHLLSFKGSETVTVYPFIRQYYHADLKEVNMCTVPASEHSVMSSFGRENEIDAFRNMLRVYPSGIVSIVSDTYDIYRVVTQYAKTLKEMILQREGKVVFRPDSGNPEHIICGNPNAVPGSHEYKGILVLLEETFGSYINAKGYKVLHDKVGVIYGDAMHLARYQQILERMANMGFAASNLVIGVGRYLRDFNRDSMGFSFKATYIEIEGTPRIIEKDPITDQHKKSHKGLLCLLRENGQYRTLEMCSKEQEQQGELKVVWKDGKLSTSNDMSLSQLRQKIRNQLSRLPLRSVE